MFPIYFYSYLQYNLALDDSDSNSDQTKSPSNQSNATDLVVEMIEKLDLNARVDSKNNSVLVRFDHQSGLEQLFDYYYIIS